MKKFSERLGLIEAPRLLQTEGMSDALRNSLWNFVVSMFDAKEGEWLSAASWIAQFFRKVPVDELPHYDNKCREWIKAYFFSLHWYEVYDFIEFIPVSDLDVLLRSIVVSPEAEPWFVELIQDVCRKYKVSAPVRRSKLAFLPT